MANGSGGGRSDEIDEFEDSEGQGILWTDQEEHDVGLDLEEDELQFLDEIAELAILQSGKIALSSCQFYLTGTVNHRAL